MSQHEAAIQWQRSSHPLDERTYSRNHVASLAGDQFIHMSASVEFKGDPKCADPEQLLVSAVASCHMLTFLAIAEFQKYRVEAYEDRAVGYLDKVDGIGMAITRIDLSPKITFSGDKMPDAAALARLHAGAHKNCFIRNSVIAKVSLVGDEVTA